MSFISDALSYIPQLSTPMAGGMIAGGGTLAHYGYRKWSQANGFQEKLQAGSFMAAGLGLATVGTLGAISNVWQSAFPSNSAAFAESIPTTYPDPNLDPLKTCHTVFQVGIPAKEMRIYSAEFNELDKFIPAMQEGTHYIEAKGYMDHGYLYCWAKLTDLGKQLLGKESLSVHTDSIPGTAYAKINMR